MDSHLCENMIFYKLVIDHKNKVILFLFLSLFIFFFFVSVKNFYYEACNKYKITYK